MKRNRAIKFIVWTPPHGCGAEKIFEVKFYIRLEALADEKPLAEFNTEKSLAFCSSTANLSLTHYNENKADETY